MSDLVDLWILEVQDAPAASRGIMDVFGVDAPTASKVVSRIPASVRRGVKEDDLPRWIAALGSLPLTLGVSAAGAKEAPPPWQPPVEDIPPPMNPRLAPAPNIPDVPDTSAEIKRATWVAAAWIAAGGVLLLIRAASGMPSLLAEVPALAGSLMDALAIASLSVGIHSLGVVRGFDLAYSPSVQAVGAVFLLGAGVGAAVPLSYTPDPLDAQRQAQLLQNEVLAGQVPEARARFARPGARVVGGDGSAGRQLVESLYLAGARRVYAVDAPDGDVDALMVELPVPLGTRQAIGGAYRAWLGSSAGDVPPEALQLPPRARFWRIPVFRASEGWW